MAYITLIWLLGQSPIATALVIGLFWGSPRASRRITKPFQFRLAALCLGVSLIASVIIPIALLAHFPEDSRADRHIRISPLPLRDTAHPDAVRGGLRS